MTIAEAIYRIDEIKPNGYSPSEKIKWLSSLDGTIKTEIVDTHEGREAVQFKGYNDNTDLDTKLIVDAPYDDIYLRWLESRIDYSNGEYGKYNNSATAFNESYSRFSKWYNREHMPLQRGKFKY